MSKLILFIGVAGIPLAFKTSLAFSAFKKRLYIFYPAFLLFYTAIGVFLNFLVERVSFSELISFLLRTNTLIFIGSFQVLIAVIMILSGLGKIKKDHSLNKYEKYFSIALGLPCPFSLVYLTLAISYFQKLISGVSNLVISIGCVAAYFFLVSLLAAMALKIKWLGRLTSQATIMLGLLYIALVFSLPMLLSNQILTFNEGGTIMNIITRILYLISNAHLIPVIISLIALFCLSLILLGRHLAEYLARLEDAGKIKDCWQALEDYRKALDEPAQDNKKADLEIINLFQERYIGGYLGKFTNAIRDSLNDKLKIGKIIDNIELDMSHRVERMVLMTRIGPMLGLMGTLIPMGPALTNLASGNLSEMANQMVVAFTTTVLGLTIGGVSYFVSIVRRRWYLEDLNNIEYLFEVFSHFRESVAKETVCAINNNKELSLETQ